MPLPPGMIDPVVLYYIGHDRTKQWCRPIYQSRHIESEYVTLFPKLREDQEKFQNYARMSIESFDLLHSLISTSIRPGETNYRPSISTEERLLMTLRYLATGCSFGSVGYSFRAAPNTVAGIVHDTCSEIWNNLQEAYMPSPNRTIWKENEKRFLELWNFPHCIGAIDGKHVAIQCPPNQASSFFNYKGFHSIVVQAISNADCLFTAIDVGEFGRNSDGAVLKNSNFGASFQRGLLEIPEPSEMPGSSKILPYVLVGDEAYPQMENLLRPYPSCQLNNTRRIFNARLSRSRKTVERAFGMVTRKFEFLQRPLRCSVDHAVEITRAAFLLHNFIRVREGVLDNQTWEIPNSNCLADQNPVKYSGRSSLRAAETRNGFADYFTSDAGKLQWLEDAVTV